MCGGFVLGSFLYDCISHVSQKIWMVSVDWVTDLHDRTSVGSI
jgi:hypothetical protein